MKHREKSSIIFIVMFSIGVIIAFGAIIHLVMNSSLMGSAALATVTTSVLPPCNGSVGVPFKLNNAEYQNEIEVLKSQLLESSKKVQSLQEALTKATTSVSTIVTPTAKSGYAAETSDNSKPLLQSNPILEDGVMVKAIEATLKSCLDSSCLQATTKQADGQEIQRIGLLTPDPFLIYQPFISKLETYPSKDGVKAFAFSSHVPPYGYGKNHGWTKIIRLYESIPSQAYRLLKSHRNNNNEKEWELMFDTQVRQLARWHCRLNHVAAHTSMLTVTVDDLLSRPQFTLQTIFSFVGYKPNKAELDNMVQTIIPELKKHWKSFDEEITKNTLDIAETALGDELAMSQGLQKWPCANFMELEKKVILPTIRYYQLSANCSDSNTKCSVGFDKREQMVVARK